MSNADIAEEILRLVRARGPGKTICPSEVARSLAVEGNDWRARMPAIRAVAATLSDAGAILITQKGQVVPDVAAVRGPIRLGLPPQK